MSMTVNEQSSKPSDHCEDTKIILQFVIIGTLFLLHVGTAWDFIS